MSVSAEKAASHVAASCYNTVASCLAFDPKKKKRVGKSVSAENADSYVDMHLHINEDYSVVLLDFTKNKGGGGKGMCQGVSERAPLKGIGFF